MKNLALKTASVFASAALCTALTLSASPVSAQQSDAQKQIVGVWKLLSSTNTAKDGTVTKGTSYGPTPAGRMIFTAGGHYSVINTNPSIPKFASGNRMQGTPEENKAVVKGSNASFGTYSVSPDGKVLTLKIEGGTWPAWNGTEQKRGLVLKGDELRYSLASSIGGNSELVYSRLK